jgi:hypothetical protein
VELILGLIGLAFGLWLISFLFNIGMFLIGLIFNLPFMIWNALTGKPIID